MIKNILIVLGLLLSSVIYGQEKLPYFKGVEQVYYYKGQLKHLRIGIHPSYEAEIVHSCRLLCSIFWK
jgi:hypothetical protein